MKSSTLAHLYAMLALSGCFADSGNSTSTSGKKSISDREPLTDEEKLIVRKNNLLKRGNKEFHYHYQKTVTETGILYVVALNKKNADRKYIRTIKLLKEKGFAI